MTAQPDPLLVVVMGVSGTGKSTVGERLAADLGFGFVEGDAHHPPSNIARMSAGVALTDADRWPWLGALAALAAEERAAGRSVVLTCSALKRSYRDVLRGGARACFVHLQADAAVLAERMGRRTEHFMPASLLASQLAALEPLEDDEDGVVVDVSAPVDEVVGGAVDGVRRYLNLNPDSTTVAGPLLT